MHVARHVRTHVDHRLPRLAAIDRGVVAGIAVAKTVIDSAGEQTRIGPAPMEHSHLMAVVHRQLHRMPTYERRPTNEQQPHNTSTPWNHGLPVTVTSTSRSHGTHGPRSAGAEI